MTETLGLGMTTAVALLIGAFMMMLLCVVMRMIERDDKEKERRWGTVTI